MKMTDGKKTVEIRMMTWADGQYTPDWSNDFFEAGQLSRVEGSDIYIVPDVDYCIDYANDWRDRIGDFAMDADYTDDGEREVFVDEIEVD